MRIAIIGGVERVEEQYVARAARAGHEVTFHHGRVGGRGAHNLVAMLDRQDVVIVVTDTNSHGAVKLARRAMRLRGREPLLLRRCGLSRFGELLDTLGAASHDWSQRPATSRERAGRSNLRSQIWRQARQV
jgi:hypothetical protein